MLQSPFEIAWHALSRDCRGWSSALASWTFRGTGRRALGSSVAVDPGWLGNLDDLLALEDQHQKLRDTHLLACCGDWRSPSWR